MYPRSAAFDTEIQRSHVVVTRVDLLLNNVLQQTLTITDGNVTVQDDAIRRRCTLRAVDPTGSLVPSSLSDLLAPGGAEMQLWRGVKYFDGTTELLPLGVYGISKYRLDDSGEGMTVQIDGFDRSRREQRAKFATDYPIPANTNYISAVQAFLQQQWPPIQFGTVVPTTLVTPVIVLQAGKDPWGEARRLLGNIGYEIFFDQNGLCVIQPVQVLSTVAQWNLVEGTSATILSLTKQMTDEGFFNHTVVTGESSQTTTPARGEAKDNTPSSPTYVGGPIGDVVDFYTGSEITSNPQAQAVANARLNKSLGLPMNVDTTDVVHPAIDLEDVVQITRSRSKLNDLFVVDKLAIPLTSERAMSLSTRQRLVGV